MGLLESSFAVVECTSTCLSRPVRSQTFPSEYKWLTNFLLSTALGFYKTKDTWFILYLLFCITKLYINEAFSFHKTMLLSLFNVYILMQMQGGYQDFEKNPYKSVHANVRSVHQFFKNPYIKFWKICLNLYIFIKYHKICMMSPMHVNIIMFI